jgi:hypothetical protein
MTKGASCSPMAWLLWHWRADFSELQGARARSLPLPMILSRPRLAMVRASIPLQPAL